MCVPIFIAILPIVEELKTPTVNLMEALERVEVRGSPKS